MTQEELDLILKQHKLWLNSNKKEGQQANFSSRYIDSHYPSSSRESLKITFYEDGRIYLPSSKSVINCNPTNFEIENERNLYFSGLDFSNAILTSAIFEDAIFYDCNMSNINLSECDLSKAKFGKVQFSGGSFGGNYVSRGIPHSTDSILSGAYFVRCDFSNMLIQGFDFTNSVLTKSSFEGADLMMTDFSRSRLNDAKFDNVNLRYTTFISCNMKGATLISADLTSADLSGSDLSSVDLSKANLTSADLSQANLNLVDLSGAKLDGAKFSIRKRWKRITDAFKGNLQDNHCIGCRVETAYGNERLKKMLKEEAFVEEFALEHPWLYKLWIVTSDCGRSIGLWLLWLFITINAFAVAYFGAGVDAFNFTDKIGPMASQEHYLLYVYYSIVTFTTLGFGDITPVTPLAMFIVILEVIVGFIMLGLLISLLANKVASRS